MTRKNVAFTSETIRKEQELRLYAALENVDPGSESYSKILMQISALNAHAWATEAKEREYIDDDHKHQQTIEVETLKSQGSLIVETKKVDAARQQKQADIIARIVIVSAILVFEHSGHGIVTKAFGLIRD